MSPRRRRTSAAPSPPSRTPTDRPRVRESVTSPNDSSRLGNRQARSAEAGRRSRATFVCTSSPAPPHSSVFVETCPLSLWAVLSFITQRQIAAAVTDAGTAQAEIGSKSVNGSGRKLHFGRSTDLSLIDASRACRCSCSCPTMCLRREEGGAAADKRRSDICHM